MKTKQGISLIVLVITIIVMIVLAGAIILSLNNSGIIDKASDAVQKSDEATVKELAQMAWGTAYAEGERDLKELKEAVEAALRANKLEPKDYGIVATTSGVEIAKGWLQYGLTVVKGDDTLEIGDDFQYDETAEGTKDVAWKVLGASDDGELLIMSTSAIVSSYMLGDKNFQALEEGQNDWLTGPTQLDDLCKPYGKGKSATGARSIRTEDVDKITGYDKTTYELGKIWEYGNEVTYSSEYDGIVELSYTATNGLSGKSLLPNSKEFHYYNGTDFVVVDLINEKGLITTLKSNCYAYDVKELDTIDKTNKAYTMLFDDSWYWLASTEVFPYDSGASYCMRAIESDTVTSLVLWNSDGEVSNYASAVRAVVSLAADITVTGESTNGWSY